MNELKMVGFFFVWGRMVTRARHHLASSPLPPFSSRNLIPLAVWHLMKRKNKKWPIAYMNILTHSQLHQFFCEYRWRLSIAFPFDDDTEYHQLQSLSNADLDSRASTWKTKQYSASRTTQLLLAYIPHPTFMLIFSTLSSIPELYLSHLGTYFTMILDLFWKRFMTYKNVLGVSIFFGGGVRRRVRQMLRYIRSYSQESRLFEAEYIWLEGFPIACVRGQQNDSNSQVTQSPQHCFRHRFLGIPCSIYHCRLK